MLTAAEEALKKAAKLDPALDGAWNCLGQLFWKKGNLEGAKNCYRAVLARGPNKKTHQAMSMLSRALAKSKAKPGSEEQKQLVAESMDHAKEAVKLDVADGASWYAVGMAYMAAFFADGASGAFYTLVPIRPRSRGERRSLRTFPGGSLRSSLAFNPRPRRLSTPPDAYELHPDIACMERPSDATKLAQSLKAYQNAEKGGPSGDGTRRRWRHRRLPRPALQPRDRAPVRGGVRRRAGGVPASRGVGPGVAVARRGAFHTLVPIRPRSRGERRSLRTFSPGVSLRPPLAFNPRPRRLSTPTDAFQLHPDVRLYGTAPRWTPWRRR